MRYFKSNSKDEVEMGGPYCDNDQERINEADADRQRGWPSTAKLVERHQCWKPKMWIFFYNQRLKNK